MGGIFGGFLNIIDSIGGGILYILIGGSASNLGAVTRLVRLVIGAVIFGAIVSLGIYLYAPVYAPDLAFQNISFANSTFLNDNAIPMIYVAPVAALVVTAVLELLSFALEYKPQRTEKKTRETNDLRITPNVAEGDKYNSVG